MALKGVSGRERNVGLQAALARSQTATPEAASPQKCLVAG